jgi:hypothetical protein
MIKQDAQRRKDKLLLEEQAKLEATCFAIR